MAKDVILYQTQNGAVEVRLDVSNETILLTQQQVGKLFGVQKAAISKHVKNIFASKELNKKSTVSKMETVQIEGGREIKRRTEYYNLDLVISIGYRVNSTNATKFRQWATKVLKQHIVKGYTINKKRLAKNYTEFLRTVEDIKKLLPQGNLVQAGDALELIKLFSATWFSLESYDRGSLPKNGSLKKKVLITYEELAKDLNKLKLDLIIKNEASELFGVEIAQGNLEGIVGAVFQTFKGQDLYSSLEEKAAHLLYFMVKNHPFTDGNKRSGAFAFIWFLKRVKILNLAKLSPEALTVLTLLVAESDTNKKDLMISLVLQILK